MKWKVNGRVVAGSLVLLLMAGEVLAQSANPSGGIAGMWSNWSRQFSIGGQLALGVAGIIGFMCAVMGVLKLKEASGPNGRATYGEGWMLIGIAALAFSIMTVILLGAGTIFGDGSSAIQSTKSIVMPGN